MRWCKVFPGQEDQIPEVATFVTQLLGSHPDRDPIASCAAELAANAIRHTASGQDGFFATEVTWTGQTVRVAVSDGGADTVPFTGPAGTPPAPQHAEHGLGALARLSARWGTEGDYRGRVVWAQFLASTDLASTSTGSAPVATSVPLAAERSTAAEAADLAERYKGWHTWFGHWTRQWWAIPRQASATAALIAEPTAVALALKLDSLGPA
ncbi:MAG: putative signal transduction histidine kinase [Actinomycetia bacterium]|nr:putative signal transduction histidine kinase [Actinomycetes bacterium]